MVLWGQEVLHTSTLEFGLLSTGSAIGGVAGGWLASSITARIGSGASVGLTLWLGGVVSVVIGLVSNWVVVGLLMVVYMFVAVLWNVITVSLRQAVIPDRLLGRVNSVYRFFGWGAIPIGALLGGALVAALDGPLSASGRCGCRGSSPAPASSCSPPSSPARSRAPASTPPGPAARSRTRSPCPRPRNAVS